MHTKFQKKKKILLRNVGALSRDLALNFLKIEPTSDLKYAEFAIYFFYLHKGNFAYKDSEYWTIEGNLKE